MAPPLHKVISKPEQFEAMVWEYINECKAQQLTPFKQEFALNHRVGKNQLATWREKYSKPTEHDPQCLIAGAIKSLEQASEVRQLRRLDGDSKSNVNAMFILKTQHGYMEQDKVKNTFSGGVNITFTSAVPGPLGDQQVTVSLK